jgi:type I restriction enzyme S subunit
MGSTHKTIYMPDIESLRVPLPEVEEQDRVVVAVWDRLLRFDHAVDALQAQLSLLQERRQALITAAVTGDLDVPGVAA